MAELDAEHLADALGVGALLAAVAAQQVGGLGVADALGEQLVEGLAGTLDAVDEPQRGDVELLEATHGGDGGEKVLVLVHVPSLAALGRAAS